jgi:hypothetical protein
MNFQRATDCTKIYEAAALLQEDLMQRNEDIRHRAAFKGCEQQLVALRDKLLTFVRNLKEDAWRDLLDEDPHASILLKFNKLKEEWQRDTVCEINLDKIHLHPAYLKIIALGRLALPYILRSLEQEGGHWYLALQTIVEEDVAEGLTTTEVAQVAWINWGRQKHYL